MKFRKSAKDVTGRIIQEGDLLIYPENHETIDSVVIDIKQADRDTVPQVTVKKVLKDWMGRVAGVKQVVLNVDTYRLGRVIYPSSLRDDVPSHRKVKELRDDVMEDIFSR